MTAVAKVMLCLIKEILHPHPLLTRKCQRQHLKDVEECFGEALLQEALHRGNRASQAQGKFPLALELLSVLNFS